VLSFPGCGSGQPAGGVQVVEDQLVHRGYAVAVVVGSQAISAISFAGVRVPVQAAV
jgi:hypothetical protein